MQKISSDLFMFLLFIMVFILPLSAQVKLEGRMIDGETEESLAYGNIKAASYQGSCDKNGDFSFELPSLPDSVVFTYIGYNKKTIHLGDKMSSLPSLILMSSGQEELNTVTITSGKFKKRIQDVTVSMEIIKPELISESHANSFKDILNKIPGVTSIDGQVNIRGGSGYSYGAGSRVMLLVDNLPALQVDAAYPNWDDIPIENIGQVEVLKGAGSSLYGSAAMNGVINILTKYATKETQFNIQTQTTAYLAPADSLKKWWNNTPLVHNVSTSYSKKFGNLSLVSSAFLRMGESYRNDTYNNYGRFSLKLDYPVLENLIAGVATNINKGKSRSFFYWKDDLEGAYQAESGNYSSNDKLRYTVDPFIYYYGKNHTQRFNGRIYRINNASDNDQANHSTSFYGEYQIQKKWNSINMVLTSGLVGNHAVVVAPLYGDTSFIAQNSGAYIQVEKKFRNKLTLNAGARYEINKLQGPKLINDELVESGKTEGRPVFRLGLNYELFPFSNLRASWGQGYRYPSIAEKYISTSAGLLNIVPNPSLESESGWTAELGFRQGLALGQFKSYIDISVFQSKYENMMEFNVFEGGLFQFASQNIGNTIVDGFELSTGGQISYNKLKFSCNGGYVYINPRYSDFNETVQNFSSSTENVLKYRNKHTYKFEFNVSYKNLNFNIGSNYLSHNRFGIKILCNSIINYTSF